MSDKTEQPTPRRLQRARTDGDIAKSSHLTSAVSAMSWWLLLTFEAPSLFAAFVHMTDVTLNTNTNHTFAWRIEAVMEALIEPGRIALTTLGFGILASIVPELAQTRGLIALKRIAPDFKRLDPIQGLKNLFSLKVVIDMAIILVQFGILLILAWHAVAAWLLQLAPAYALTPPFQLALASSAHARLFALSAFSLLAPAVADYAMQRVLHKRRLRMDKEEIRREHREEHGDAHVKSRRRALHRELNQRP